MIAGLLGRVLPAERHLPEHLPDGVAVLRGTLIPRLGGWLSGMRAPAAAVTLGNAIVVHPDARLTAGLLRHELAHVRQWRAAPFSFPLRYVLNHVRHGYHDNPYEVEARAAEHDSAGNTV
jgi:hypothetical protein